mmetsp:Transcript_25539/g.100870  ORF Transcript_25539/g.100870 Transcript_25539/m.100870 type:complete len:108 (-) Transcript_25539:826-1149(-)
MDQFIHSILSSIENSDSAGQSKQKESETLSESSLQFNAMSTFPNLPSHIVDQLSAIDDNGIVGPYCTRSECLSEFSAPNKKLRFPLIAYSVCSCATGCNLGAWITLQ